MHLIRDLKVPVDRGGWFLQSSKYRSFLGIVGQVLVLTYLYKGTPKQLIDSSLVHLIKVQTYSVSSGQSDFRR